MSTRRPRLAPGRGRPVPRSSTRPQAPPPPEPPPEEDVLPEWEARFVDLVDGDSGEWEEDGAPREQAETRKVPLLAIVGRPNVGKSRLFNRLTGTRFAIVEDEPGVTRDRQYGEGSWDGHVFQVVDTGGFEPEASDVLLRQMKEQATLAMEEADIILFVVDGQSGLLPADTEIAAYLRSARHPVFLVVNKIDGPRHDGFAADFYALGFDELHPISAEHGRDYDVLMDALLPHLPRAEEVQRREDDERIRIAVVGRPNAGKSTLVNQLLGEQRLLTSDIPGTTRDAINTEVYHDGKPFLLIDTAGVRRKRGISQTVEKYSVVQAFKAVDRADVVVYVLDALDGVTTQDQRLCGLVHEKGRAMILLLNKWDAVEKDHRTADEYVRRLRDELKFSRYAPVVTISARTGQRVHKVLRMVEEVHEQYQRRVPTGELNRVLREAFDRNPPPARGRRRLKMFYASQVATSPPTFMLAINHKDLVHFSYERYLQNVLRQAFGFEGTPLKVFYRERAQRSLEDEG